MENITFYENLSETAKEYFDFHNAKPNNSQEANELVYKYAEEGKKIGVRAVKNNELHEIGVDNYHVALFPLVWKNLTSDQRIKVIMYAYEDIYKKLNLKTNSKFVMFTKSGVKLSSSRYSYQLNEVYMGLEDVISGNDYDGIDNCALLAHELNHQKQFEKKNKIFNKNKYNSADFSDKHMCGENIFYYYANEIKIENFMDSKHREIYEKLGTTNSSTKLGNFVYSSDLTEVDSGRIQAKYLQNYFKNSYEAFGINYRDDKNAKSLIKNTKKRYGTEEHKKFISDDKFLPKLSNITYWTYRKYEIELRMATKELKTIKDLEKNGIKALPSDCSRCVKHIEQTKRDEKELQLYFNTFVDLMSEKRVPKNFDQNNFNKLNNVVKYVKEYENSIKNNTIKEEENEK